MNKEFGVSTVAKRKKLLLLDYYNLPESCVLVRQGGLFGSRGFKFTRGTRLLFKTTSGKVYTTTDIPINPKGEEFPCASAYNVKVDIAMTAEIVDFDLFDSANIEGNVEENVLESIRAKIRSFVADKTYEELINATHISNIIDPANRDGLRYFSKVIAGIEENYGLRIKTLIFTGVELPDYIQKAKEEYQKAEEEKKITILKANARKEEAEIDRKTKEIEMDTLIDNACKFIKNIVPVLKEQNWSDDMIRDYVMANLPNAMNIVSKGNSNTSVLDGLNFGLGMNAANQAQTRTSGPQNGGQLTRRQQNH